MKKILRLIIVVAAVFCINVSAAEVSPYELDAFFMNYCYTEQSVLDNDYEVAEVVNVGDKVVCFAGFETYSTDKVKSLKFTLEHGNGLELVDESTPELTDKTGSTYSFELATPTSVGENIAAFTFKVVGTHNLNYGIKNIEFTTSDSRSFSNLDQNSSLKFLWDDENVTFPEYPSDPFFMEYCYTEESVIANNYKRAETVGVGDKIVCFVTFETNASDKVKSFKYTLDYGSGLKLVGEELYDLSNKTGNTYSFVLESATSVGDTLGSYTFEVVGNENLNYGIKDIKFITDSGDAYVSANTGSSVKSNFKNPNTGATNIIVFAIGLIALLGTSLVVSKKFKCKFNKI